MLYALLVLLVTMLATTITSLGHALRGTVCALLNMYSTSLN